MTSKNFQFVTMVKITRPRRMLTYDSEIFKILTETSEEFKQFQSQTGPTQQ